MKSITYEEFLKLNPCWLQEKDTAKLMEEIGRSKDTWTALDVLSITHEEVSDSDKLWVIIGCGLISEEQIAKVLSISMQYVLDKTLESLSKTANEKTMTIFENLLDTTWFKACLTLFDYKLLGPHQRLSKTFKNVQVMHIRETFKNYAHRLDMTADILNADANVSGTDSDSDIEAITYYLKRLGIAMFIIATQPLMEDMLYAARQYCIISHQYDSKIHSEIEENGFEAGAPILLRIIATVIEEEESTNVKEDVQ